MTADGRFRDAGAAIQTGSASFALASRLLPPDTRLNVWLLYAWCRHCDDVADAQVMGHGGGRGSVAAVEELRQLSIAAIEGRAPAAPPFDGLAHVVATTNLPRLYVLDHLKGFEMDAGGHQCRTLDDTLAYAYHVAGVVGLMMAWLMGVTDRATLLRGCDLGIAFQLTNIARDVADDAANGRVYLPSEWLRQANALVAAGQPLDEQARHAVAPLVRRLLDEADRYYASAWYGIGRLPARSAWAVATARHVYADIGYEVRRRRARAWDQRVATPRARKLRRVVQAMAETAWTRASVRLASPPSRNGLWTPALPGMQG
jgi:phytoene synthase